MARFSALRLGFELLTQSRIRALTDEEFGADASIPDKAYPSLVTSILGRVATEHHIVFCAVGGEVQARHFPGMLRVHVVAPENVRIGNLMLDCRLERPPPASCCWIWKPPTAPTARPSSARREPPPISSTSCSTPNR